MTLKDQLSWVYLSDLSYQGDCPPIQGGKYTIITTRSDFA